MGGGPEAKKAVKSFAVPIVLALTYALLTRVLFGWDVLDRFLTIVSWSYISVMPFAFGGLTTCLGIYFCGRSKFWIAQAPMITISVGFTISYLFNLEALLCIIVAAPIMLVCAFLGGIACGALLEKLDGRVQMSMLLLLPFVSAPLETLWNQPHEQITISDSIKIRADAATVWKQIASVPGIRDEELPFQLIYLLDFPKPVSAEIDFPGVGGERRAVFERGVTFFEKVTVWEENEKLSFTIRADPEFIPRSAFDQHIVVGGRFYDVLDGTYRIEQEDGFCTLHLSSTHRISSPFNAYAGFWSGWVMDQIQGSILQVIKKRCE